MTDFAVVPVELLLNIFVIFFAKSLNLLLCAVKLNARCAFILEAPNCNGKQTASIMKGKMTVSHAKFQYYRHNYCLICMTGLLGCRWHRYQQSTRDNRKVNCHFWNLTRATNRVNPLCMHLCKVLLLLCKVCLWWWGTCYIKEQYVQQFRWVLSGRDREGFTLCSVLCNLVLVRMAR